MIRAIQYSKNAIVSWFPIWLSVVGTAGCGGSRPSDNSASPPAVAGPIEPQAIRSRQEFAERFAQIKEGMPEAQVIALLGKPDDIQTQHDGDGISLYETREIWGYGVDHHMGFATLGTVTINLDGNVQYFCGTTGAQNLVAKLGEPELRRLLRILAEVGPLTGSSFHPRRTIAAVNALQPLGQETGVAVLREYLDVSFENKWGHDEGLFAVMRTLSDVPPAEKAPQTQPENEWQRIVYPGYFRAPALGASDWYPEIPSQLPRFPLVIVDDVPLVVVAGYSLAGAAERPLEHLDELDAHAKWRSRPLQPTDNPLGVLAKLDAEIAGLRPPPTREFRREIVIDQLLSLIDTVVPAPAGDEDERSSDEDKALFDAAAAKIGATKIHWDARRCRYAFADGSALAPATAPAYRREIFEPAIAGGNFKVSVAVRRKNAIWIDVNISVEVKKGDLPLLTSSIIQVGKPEKILMYDSRRTGVEATAGDWKYSSKSLRCKLPAGQRVQIEIFRDNDRYLSPELQP